eukprot:151231_1
MGGVILAWVKRSPKPFRFAQSYVVLPFFVLMLFLSCLLACIFVITAVISADFCFSSPSEKVVTILREIQQNRGDDYLSQMLLSLSTFYIQGCKEGNLPNVIIDIDNTTAVVSDGLDVVRNFTTTVSELNTPAFQQVCGPEAFNFLSNTVDLLNQVLEILWNTLIGTKNIFLCSNINPVYVELAFDAVCYNGVSGMRAIFSSQLAIAILSMMMVTLRVSWQQI